jgi:hypothetical protein
METRPACISIADVQHAVARTFHLSVGEMLSRKRGHHLAGARQVAMYLSRELAGGGWMGLRRRAASFPRIGMAFARDHTSVIHACNAVARRREADPEFAQLLDRIARELIAARHYQGPACHAAVSVWNSAVSILTLRVQRRREALAADALPEELDLFYVVDRLPRLIGGALDACGNGQYLAEIARQRYGARIEQVMLSAQWYRENMPSYKAAFEDRMVELPRDAEILADHRALEVEHGYAHVPDRREQKGRHGDAAIAAGCAVRARARGRGCEGARHGHAVS